MGCSWAIAVALWWLLRARERSHCCGRVVLLSHCCGLVVAFACGSGACWACWGTFSLRSWPDFWRVWRVLEGLRPGKRQPWTRIRSHCCGRGVRVPLSHCCGLVVAFACGSGACWAQCRQRAGCNAGTLTARGLGGSCREGCAGKGQAATLEQQRLPARGRGGSCLECPNERGLCAGKGGFEAFYGFEAGKRQARMP